MVSGKDAQQTAKDLPLFIPPRKRQSTKKSTGSHNYVDHIVAVQGRGSKNSTPATTPVGGDSSSSSMLIVKSSSSLLLKKSLDNLSVAVASSSSASGSGDLNAIRQLTKSNDTTLHELHHHHHHHHNQHQQHHGRYAKEAVATTANKNSCYSVESSSLDAKSIRSHDCLATGQPSDVITNANHSSALHSQRQYQKSLSQPSRSGCTTPQSPPVSVGTANSSSILTNYVDESTAATSISVGGGGRSYGNAKTMPTQMARHLQSEVVATGAGRQLSFSRYTDTIASDAGQSVGGGGNYLTMTGTVQRGRKKGQSVDLQLNMSRDELEKIQAAALVATGGGGGGGGGANGASSAMRASSGCCQCTRTVGLHVLLLSLLCLPFVTLATGVYSFYIGTLTWYNLFNYFNEERSVWLRMVVSPLLVVLYPVLILLCTLGLAVYAGVVQLSVRFHSWLNEIGDVEKGFYGWLCALLRMSDCSPYEVVVLVDLKMGDDEATAEGGGGAKRLTVNSSTEEELSL